MEYEMAKALTCRALAAVGRNERQPALELLRRAGQLFARQENQVWVAMVELYRAWILFDDNRLAEAVRHADAAATGFRHAGVASRAALCEILRARLATGLGDLAAARRRGAKALEMALESGRPLLEFQAHLTTAQIAEAEGDPRAALSGYSRAHRALERLRLRLRTDELKIAFTDDKQAVYEGLVAVTLATGRSVEQWKTALGHVEMAKSRSLADLLACGPPRAADRAGDGDPLVAELGELRRALDWTYRRIGDEELEGGEARQRRLGRLRDEAREQERRLLRNLRRLRAVDHELSSLQGPFITDLESLQQALPEDGALVEYFIARDIVYRFDLDREGLQARVIGAAKPLRELCRQLQFQSGRFHVGGNHLERFGELFHTQTLTLLEELRDALLGDWRPASGIRQLIVVPHGLLHHIPFHALYDGERFLVDELSISYAPSATVFQLCATRGGESSGRSLVMAIPDERAPRILDEARAVAEILPESLLLVGEEATVESLKRLGNGCRFVHISTHGLHRRDNPMFSALELGDARLSLLDLYDLELEVELAVLSGCGTGLSYVQGSDELVGLTRGLLFAGARSVLATLWEVNDESTADLMRLFYGRLATDPRPARALQHAMATLRQTHPHPYYWAPFVLTGRP
jgi:tetratricopeptide (TPR) repeat protein